MTEPERLNPIREALMLLRAESSVHLGVEAPGAIRAIEVLDELESLVARDAPWPPERVYLAGLLGVE